MTEAKTPIKMLVTYDSLQIVYKYIKKDAEHVESSQKNGRCHLIIDESDKLISYMSMKVNSKRENQYMDTITYLFKVAEECKSTVSFISATPIDVAYLPEWVSTIDQIELLWKHTEKVIPITMKRTYPYNALEEEVIRPMQKEGKVTIGESEITKVIVFINSVDKIVQIIKECQLDKNDVAIICGDTSRNSYKIRGYYVLEDPHRLPKYTFVTSSGFQGIDLFDEEAMNVVVSYTGKSYQMIDLNTDLIQATSRQRQKTNPNFHRFVYIYDQNPFGEKSEEELISEIEAVRQRICYNCETLLRIDKAKNEQEYKSAVETFSQSGDFRRYTFKQSKDDDYQLNENVFNAERYRILETRRAYTEGFDIIKDNFGKREVEPIVVPEPKHSRKLSYISIMYKYKRIINEMTPRVIFDDDFNIVSVRKEPERNEKGYIVIDRSRFDEEELASTNFRIVDAYYREYGKFNSNSTYARRMVRVSGDEGDQMKVRIQSLFSVGRYTLAQIKPELERVYLDYDIIRKPKYNDLEEYGYKCKKVKPHNYIFIDILETPKID